MENDMMESTCHMCEMKTKNSTVLVERVHLETLSFLKNGFTFEENTSICQSCFEKVQMISNFKASNNVPKNDSKKEPSDNVKSAKELKEGEDQDEEDDVDLQELDLLSSYYAEQDDDPDFVPNNIPKKSVKKPIKVQKKNVITKVELKCQLCVSTFSRVIALRRHFMNDHEDTERAEWKCKECNEILSDKAALIGHFIKIHVAVYQCKKCSKKFRLARSLRNHIANYCPQISGQQKPCDVCEKLMPQNMLASHKAFSHICSNCNAILPNRREKCKHLREVHKITKSLKNSAKSHTCRNCQQIFPNSLLLSEHLVAKHSDDINLVTACPHQNCKQKFPKGSIKLRTHLKKFHGNDSTASNKLYKFECQICFSKFKSSQILKSHIQSKHDENKIKCPYCPYILPLKRKSDLYRHHFRVAHPEITADIIKEHDSKLAKWKADLAARAKIQCLMCSFAGVKSSNMARYVIGFFKAIDLKSCKSGL